MATNVEWVIYYADGSRYTSATHNPEDTPPTGVEVVLVRDGRGGRRKLMLCDYYGWSPSLGRWIELQDAAAVVVRAMREPLLIRAGQYLREKDFEEILIRADNDTELPAVPPNSPPHPAWKKDF